MERVLVRRIRYVLETGGFFSMFQAGFREGHNVEEQLVRLSQEVWDSFQARDRTVMALFDICRAYDKVLRDGLLWKLSGAGVDEPVIQ